MLDAVMLSYMSFYVNLLLYRYFNNIESASSHLQIIIEALTVGAYHLPKAVQSTLLLTVQSVWQTWQTLSDEQWAPDILQKWTL